jgi:hypothetical protein
VKEACLGHLLNSLSQPLPFRCCGKAHQDELDYLRRQLDYLRRYGEQSFRSVTALRSIMHTV